MVFLGIIFLVCIYLLIAACRLYAGNVYNGGVIVHYNDIALWGFDIRKINKCKECNYLFSDYAVYETQANESGCPCCGAKNSIGRVHANIVTQGNWLLLSSRNFWSEVK